MATRFLLQTQKKSRFLLDVKKEAKRAVGRVFLPTLPEPERVITEPGRLVKELTFGFPAVAALRGLEAVGALKPIRKTILKGRRVLPPKVPSLVSPITEVPQEIFKRLPEKEAKIATELGVDISTILLLDRTFSKAGKLISKTKSVLKQQLGTETTEEIIARAKQQGSFARALKTVSPEKKANVIRALRAERAVTEPEALRRLERVEKIVPEPKVPFEPPAAPISLVGRPIVPEIKPIKAPELLISEAKKYKTAEEFIRETTKKQKELVADLSRRSDEAFAKAREITGGRGVRENARNIKLGEELKTQAIREERKLLNQLSADKLIDIWQQAQPPIAPPKAPVVKPTIPEVQPPIEKPTITPKQIKQIATIANTKNLISEKGKFRPQFRFLAKQMTGKRSLKEMTAEEARVFTETLDKLEVKGERPPKFPRTTDLITQEFAEKIPTLQEVGLKEQFRPAIRVFEKIGLTKEVFEPAFRAEVEMFEAQTAFRKEALAQRAVVGRTPESSKRIFRIIEQTLTPEDKALVTSEEQKVAEWGRKFFNQWADRLKLPQDKRRKNYVTHIFEEEIAEELKTKNPIDLDIVKNMEFITPKTIFNPFLQKRLGKKVGLREDFWSALEAYEARQLKVFFYEPLIKKIRVYEKFLPPNATRFLRGYITRITGRPLALDRELKQDFIELAGVVEKLPGGMELAKFLRKGNAAGILAYNFTGVLYEMFLGLRPASAIKNLSQNVLTIAETGAGNFAKGRVFKVTKEGKEALSKSLVFRSRKLGFLPGVDETFLQGLDSARRKVTLAMFKIADRENVGNAFSAGFTEAKNLGLPDNWAIRRGDEVAAKTQFIYSKLGGAAWSQSVPGRVLSVLTTWPTNWLELMVDFGTGKPSAVYAEFERVTGKKVNQEVWPNRRKQLLRYMMFVALAFAIEKKTRFKALAYTGFTSVRSLANLAKGQFAGLDLPGSIAQLVAGLALGDKKLIKKAWTRIRPDRAVIISRQLEDIMVGKKDWLDLFFLLEKKDVQRSKFLQGGQRTTKKSRFVQ